MKKIQVSVLCCLLIISLSACAFDTLDKGLPRLKGEHIDTAINYLGMPDEEQQIAGRKVYVWGHQNSGSYTTPVTQNHSYTAYGYGGPYTARGTTTSYVTQNYNYVCTIKLIVNKKDIIQSSEYEGNEGGCEYFASGISQLIKDTEPATPKDIATKTKK